MNKEKFYLITLLFLLGSLGYLTYEIMSPFFNAIAWAVVLSIIFYPAYAFIARWVKIKALAAAITVILILIVLLGPITYLTLMLVDEVQAVAAKIENSGAGSLGDIVQRLNSTALFGKMREYSGLQGLLSEDAITESVRNFGKKLIEFFSVRVTNIFGAVIDFIFAVFTTFFLLKDGPGFFSRARDFMPFNEVQKNKLGGQIKDMIVSTVYGGVVVAIIQGILGGMAFGFIGIEAPVMWGTAMSIMSFVPFLGTFSIWGPTSLYLLFKQQYIQGIGLLLFGVFVISMVDNILKPLIIGSRTKMPTIIILFSVIGGIKLLGVIGLIMGPLITAVFISVFEIFRHTEDDAIEQPPLV